MKCQGCKEDVDELKAVKRGKKTVKLCESCADADVEQAEIGEAAESVMQGMMEYKGRR